MKKPSDRRRSCLLVLLMMAQLMFANSPASGQQRNYKPGEKIEYKSWGYPETWEEATFVKPTPDGAQAIIRQKPSEFQQDGFQRAASWADIRPLSTKPDKAAVDNGLDRKPIDAPKAAISTKTETKNDFGVGLMTQAEVLNFVQTRLGDNPFQNPRREEIKKELAEMIKARGVDFRYSEVSQDYSSKLAKFGANTSEVAFPLRDNFGEPTKQSFLMGTWRLGKIGAAVDYEKNDRIYRQGEIGVSNVGTLTINANGTYVWKATAAPSVNGNWRIATKEEMRSQGGDGIVLLAAKSSYNWIVTKNRNTTLPGVWISISELATRQINEYGSRGGRK